MADFTVGMTDTTALDDSVKLAFTGKVISEAPQINVMDPYVEHRFDLNAKSIQMAKYDNLALATTPLTEKEDPDSEAMVDSAILLTPVEYGNVVTTTNLASLQTGGQDAMAAMTRITNNMMETKNKLATVAIEAVTAAKIIYADGGSDDTTLADTDIITGALMNDVYNKLSRANVQKINGVYVMFAHDDVIHDIRAASAAGDWVDVTKYALPGEQLANEVGMFKGFRVVRNNHCTFADQSGAGTTDAYKTSFLGANGLGLAESQIPQIVITPGYDKLNRFSNVGWKATMQYKIIDTSAVWQLVSASSKGANAS